MYRVDNSLVWDVQMILYSFSKKVVLAYLIDFLVFMFEDASDLNLNFFKPTLTNVLARDFDAIILPNWSVEKGSLLDF